MTAYTCISGTGSYVPQRQITNEELSQRLETSDQWIRERTGICKRHVAADDEYTSHLGIRAGQAAMDAASLTADELDLIIVATATPDQTFPACAPLVQRGLGNIHAAAFDLNAACSGFIYALHTADMLMRSGQYRHALIIGAETMSRVVDWEDRRTAILFGDGAGACVLSRSRNGEEQGILHSTIASDGQYAPMLQTTGGISRTASAGVLEMQGKEVFRHAVEKMAHSVIASMEAANLPLAAIDHLVPHQANARILSACAKRLELPDDKLVMTVDQHANTSSASIPLALDYATKSGKIRKGDLVMLAALGAGFTWGSCLIRW